MRKLIGVLLLCLSAQAGAVFVGGVTVPEKIRLDKGELVLNGAGARTKVVFTIYVAALYLENKTKDAQAILDSTGARRVELHVTYKLTAGEFMEAFNKAIRDNLTPEEYAGVAARMIHFARAFRDVGEVDKGSVIMIDYLPSIGTVLTVNGKERQRIAGADFYSSMLKIWLGKNPVQDSVKKALLGG